MSHNPKGDGDLRQKRGNGTDYEADIDGLLVKESGWHPEKRKRQNPKGNAIQPKS